MRASKVMAESSRIVRSLAFALALSLLGDAASSSAQATPAPTQPAPAPTQAPPPAYPGNAPPPAAAPSSPQQPYQQQQYQQQQYQQQQYPQQQYPQQGAPPPAGYAPQQSPLVGQPAQPGYGAQPGYAQQTVPWQPPRRVRTRKGLMIAGIAVFGAFYVLSSGIGSALMDEGSDWDNHHDVGRLLFIPLVGPFVAMSQTNEGDWGLWWLGMGQVAGAGMLVGGIIQYVNSKRRAEAEGFAQWKLPGERKLSLDMATSATFAGPRMRLAF